MSITLYYFSGTGNSLYITKEISKRTSAKMVSIASLINQESVNVKDEIVGLIFPVYYGHLPLIVNDFVKKLSIQSDTFIFAVATYGGSSGITLSLLKQMMESKGGMLCGAYGIHMPQNAFRKPWEKPQKVIERSKKKIAVISEHIQSRKKDRFTLSVFLEYILLPLTLLFVPLTKWSFIKKTKASSDSSFESLMHQIDKTFLVNDRCNGCGLCSKICPVNNIKIDQGRPVWLHQCQNCTACYHWCPQEAIEGGVVSKGYRYHHPDIRVDELLNH